MSIPKEQAKQMIVEEIPLPQNWTVYSGSIEALHSPNSVRLIYNSPRMIIGLEKFDPNLHRVLRNGSHKPLILTLYSNNSLSVPHGQENIVDILFSTQQKYISLRTSEGLSHSNLFEILQLHIGCMTEVVFEHCFQTLMDRKILSKDEVTYLMLICSNQRKPLSQKEQVFKTMMLDMKDKGFMCWMEAQASCEALLALATEIHEETLKKNTEYGLIFKIFNKYSIDGIKQHILEDDSALWELGNELMPNFPKLALKAFEKIGYGSLYYFPAREKLTDILLSLCIDQKTEQETRETRREALRGLFNILREQTNPYILRCFLKFLSIHCGDEFVYPEPFQIAESWDQNILDITLVMADEIYKLKNEITKLNKELKELKEQAKNGEVNQRRTVSPKALRFSTSSRENSRRIRPMATPAITLERTAIITAAALSTTAATANAATNNTNLQPLYKKRKRQS